MLFLAILGGLMVAGGLAGLGHTVRVALRIRREGGTGPDVAARFRGLIALNLASVAGATLGLGLLVVYFTLR